MQIRNVVANTFASYLKQNLPTSGYLLMSKRLVVVGATGFQGGAVISWFQQNEPSWRIRGMTRNTASDAAIRLARSGLEVVQADLNDKDSLQAAFKGAQYIFAFTDFAALIPGAMAKFEAGEIPGPVGAETLRIETQQGRNVADVAASLPELERLVWSSAPHVGKLSNGRYDQVWHFDAKARVAEYMLGLEPLKAKVSIMHMGIFSSNMFRIKHLWGVKMVTCSFFHDQKLPLSC